MMTVVLDSLKDLATSCELQHLQFRGLLCQVKPNTDVFQHKIDFNDNYKLSHLSRVKFTGITGSSAELKLIEYVLAISEALENFLYKGMLGLR
ncbi:hypothetical protein SOVF_186270 isoform B, partial [Spinacia oleracea]